MRVSRYLGTSTLLAVALLLGPISIASAASTVTTAPDTIIQGDPIFITIETSSPDTVTKVTFGETAIPFFSYQGKTRALVGIDIAKKPGDYTLRINFSSGEKTEKVISILPREKKTETFSIPPSLGGTNTSSAQTLVSTLAQENATFIGLRTGTHAFWREPFRAPLAGPLAITDRYGYSRDTSGTRITHKGTDFRAQSGTNVYAMNRGVVRIARTYRNYGKTVVVDHGLGLQTFYMHLSEIHVNPGELVLPGSRIGKSGQTGYALAPHLHISIRIKETSIDPETFLNFFGVEAQQ